MQQMVSQPPTAPPQIISASTVCTDAQIKHASSEWKSFNSISMPSKRYCRLLGQLSQTSRRHVDFIVFQRTSDSLGCLAARTNDANVCTCAHDLKNLKTLQDLESRKGLYSRMVQAVDHSMETDCMRMPSMRPVVSQCFLHNLNHKFEIRAGAPHPILWKLSLESSWMSDSGLCLPSCLPLHRYRL